MAKRFTATEKWDDPWFHMLAPNLKLAWFFLLDKCDHAGIWNVNTYLIQFHLGFIPTVSEFGGRVLELSAEKWFIPKFIQFQYGPLDEKNRAHLSVIDRLKKEGIDKGLLSPLQGAKDKDKDTDKESLEGGVGETKTEGPTPADLVTLWNKTAHPSLPRVQHLTDARKTHAKCRLSEFPEQRFWEDVMTKVNRSPHLRGENDRNWRASFDWILNPTNLTKVVEGNYDPDKRR